MNTNELRQDDMCCGCGICQVICPQQAITMECNEKGFIYPIINDEKCIDCGLCKLNCSYGKGIEKDRIGSYAAVSSNYENLMISSSGGVFSSIAYEFLKEGQVCGATTIYMKDAVRVEHVLIHDRSSLELLQGSKYVQSDLQNSVSEMKRLLATGEKILFSGTPCQVAGIKGLYKRYLGTQLYTIDLICHGVPSQKMFNDYLKEYQQSNNVHIEKFEFRNKKYGWGANGVVKLRTKEGDIETRISPSNSSYYHFFYRGEICRDSCYHCPYANINRVGDITIGDFWGIEETSPELLAENGGNLDKEKGISCLLINTEAGKRLIEKYGKDLQIYRVNDDDISKYNTQLKCPVKASKLRRKILDGYLKYGYINVEEKFNREKNIIKLKTWVKGILPVGLKNGLKKIMYK